VCVLIIDFNEEVAVMNHKKTILIFVITGFISALSVGISAHGQTVNLVKEEMLALDPVFKKIIDAVVLGDMKKIKPVLKEVHEAREEVEKAVKAGQKIVLQKNQDQFKEFVELDDKFHEDFEALEKAAEAGNKKLVKDLTHKLLDACVVCHERFKK
jgi:soluble cytochrome b562